MYKPDPTPLPELAGAIPRPGDWCLAAGHYRPGAPDGLRPEAEYLPGTNTLAGTEGATPRRPPSPNRAPSLS